MDELILKEFDRQVENLINIGYPKYIKLSEKNFSKTAIKLKNKLEVINFKQINIEKGQLPFVLVVNSSLLSAEAMMSLVLKNTKEGVTNLHPLTSLDFKVIDTVDIPKETMYVIINIDRGSEFLNVRPEAALKIIYKQNRSPLSINEGIAVVTQYPEFLIKNNCFSLLASRTGKDQRVPAIWINAKKQPNLGWCWDRNPHTWLGSASCDKRI